MHSFFQKAGLVVIACETLTELALSINSWDVKPDIKWASVGFAAVVSLYSAYFKEDAIENNFFPTEKNQDDGIPLLPHAEQIHSYGTNNIQTQADNSQETVKKYLQFSLVLTFSLLGAAGQSARAFFQVNEMFNSLPIAKNYLSDKAGQDFVMTSAIIAGAYSLLTEGVAPIHWLKENNYLPQTIRNKLEALKDIVDDSCVVPKISKFLALLGSLNHAALEGGSIYFLLSEVNLQFLKLDWLSRAAIALVIGMSLCVQNFIFQGRQVTENCLLTCGEETRRSGIEEASHHQSFYANLCSTIVKMIFVAMPSLLAHFSLSFFTVDRGLKNLPKSGLSLTNEAVIKTIAASAASIAAVTELLSETTETFHEMDERCAPRTLRL